MRTIIKAIDVVVFAACFMVAANYYVAFPLIFDAVAVVALIYVAARNPDVNTVSLISIILTVRLVSAAVFFAIGEAALNPYLFYFSLVVMNGAMIGVVIARPVLLAKYGPKFLKQNKRLTMTHQDAMIAWLYFAHAALPALTLIEHIIRHLDDLDFSPMFFYILYKPAQLFLAVLGILVLYFMTYEKSKEARDERKRRKLDA